MVIKQLGKDFTKLKDDSIYGCKDNNLAYIGAADKQYVEIIIATSGGYDPIHIGHIRSFREAAKLGKLVVILDSDNFLMKKKGYVFIPFKERKEVIESIKYVDKVMSCIDKDNTVCKTLKKLKPDIFAKGGDRTLSTIPDAEKKLVDSWG